MPNLWFIYLVAAIVLVGLPGCTVCVPFILLGRLWRPLQNQMGRIASFLIRCMFSLNRVWLNADIKLNLPKGLGSNNHPYLIVSNHRSHLDAFFLLSYIPNVRLLAKLQLFFVPFLGVMMWVLRQIPVKSKSLESYFAALEVARRGLKAGDVIHIFPESTRCDMGYKGVQRFNPGAFQLAMQEKVKIIPLVFANTDRAWPKGKLRLSFRQKVVVESLTIIDPAQFTSIQALLETTKARIEDSLSAADYEYGL